MPLDSNLRWKVIEFALLSFLNEEDKNYYKEKHNGQTTNDWDKEVYSVGRVESEGLIGAYSVCGNQAGGKSYAKGINAGWRGI